MPLHAITDQKSEHFRLGRDPEQLYFSRTANLSIDGGQLSNSAQIQTDFDMINTPLQLGGAENIIAQEHPWRKLHASFGDLCRERVAPTWRSVNVYRNLSRPVYARHL